MSTPDLDISSCNTYALNELKQRFPKLDEVTIAHHLLYAGNGEDIPATVKHINAALQWRETALPITSASIARECESGKIFTRGFDKLGHPLIIYNSSLNDPNTRNLDEVEKLFIFMMETALNSSKASALQGSKGGSGGFDAEKFAAQQRHRCKVSVLLNRANANKHKPDIDLLKRIGSLIERNYPLRIYKVYVHPTSILMKSAWQVCKRFLPSIANDLLRPKTTTAALREVIPDEFIPAELGGESRYVFSVHDFPSPFLSTVSPPTEENLAVAAASATSSSRRSPRALTPPSDEQQPRSTHNSSRHQSGQNSENSSYNRSNEGAAYADDRGRRGQQHSPNRLNNRGDGAADGYFSPGSDAHSPKSPGSWSSAARK